MCGGGAPKVQKRDVAAEQAAADRKATLAANAELAYRRSKRKSQSLIANPGGAGGVSSPGSVISQPVGKDTLGG